MQQITNAHAGHIQRLTAQRLQTRLSFLETRVFSSFGLIVHGKDFQHNVSEHYRGNSC